MTPPRQRDHAARAALLRRWGFVKHDARRCAGIAGCRLCQIAEQWLAARQGDDAEAKVRR